MASPKGDQIHVTDSQQSFSGGVNSNAVSTIVSPSNPDPNGLQRDELAWMVNCGCRDGGITQRSGWNLLMTVADGSAIYQGGAMYEPDFADPYLMLSIGGKILAVTLSGTLGVSNLSAAFGLSNPPTVPQAYFAQGEQFMVIQAGDYGSVPVPTLPLFWDGVKLTRSIGIHTPVAPGTPGVSQLPAATAMVYYQGRMWYAQGRTYAAGDIVKGASGTLPYRFNDAILNVTENPLAVGGDNFSVPASAGNVRALAFTANIDTTLGQGPLYIFTRKKIFSLVVPISRADWIKADANNPPTQTVAQNTNGGVNDRSVVAVNGDLFYQSLEPAIRSLISAIRYYQQWANTPISSNVDRLIQFNNRALLRYSSGVAFENRMIQTALPRATAQGVVHDALAVLDFQPVSSFKKPALPVWEGSWEGLEVMQMFTGDFGGLERMFAVVRSNAPKTMGQIQIWEFTNAEQFDLNANGQARVTWQVEFPSYTCGQTDLQKQLETSAFWFDRVYGIVDINVEFRPDSDSCWHFWHQFRMCQAKNNADFGQVTYPVLQFCEGNEVPVRLPKPPATVCSNGNNRPIIFGYQFQVRLTIKGFCRLRRQRMFCLPRDEAPFYGMTPC